MDLDSPSGQPTGSWKERIKARFTAFATWLFSDTRKGAVTDRFTQAVQGVLEPGERLQAGAKSGGNAGFLWVTDRRVILIRSTWFKARPKGLAWVEPRRASAIQYESVSFGESTSRTHAPPEGHRKWCSLRYARADGEQVRLTFDEPWMDEVLELLKVLGWSSKPIQSTPWHAAPQSGGSWEHGFGIGFLGGGDFGGGDSGGGGGDSGGGGGGGGG
jgi:hypothetical protein